MITRTLGSIARNLVLAAGVALLVLGSGAAAAREIEPAPRDLFATSSVRGSINRSAEPMVIRSRYVMLNLELLLDADGTPHDLAAGNSLVLNLFDDAALVGVLESVEPAYGGGYTWTGRLHEEPLSLITLAVTEGIMAGSVISSSGVFEISYAGNGIHAVYEIDQSALPPEAAPIPVSIPEGEQVAVPSAVADDGSRIDVMVVYTPAARAAVGGTSAMTSKINLAVSETNDTYYNSAITQRLNLVHTAEVYYVEGAFKEALYDLTDPYDGQMDVVHTLRNTYSADEVVLIVNDTEYCGVAWQMQTVSLAFEDHAFAVVYWRCATSPYYSFGHELGHNMGAQHDLYAVIKYDDGPGAYSYSYGYVNTIQGWRTVMAYGDACGGCLRIPFWSNPNVFYSGVPVGTASADNHRTLNNTAWTVANFRIGGSPPDAPTNLNATAVPPWRIDLSWTDKSNDEDGFRIERSSGGGWSALAEVPANTTGYADKTATPGTLYSYRVFAHNAAGDSDPSNTDSAMLPVIVGPLVYDGYGIDDDNSWGTTGNDNGLIECEETVGLTVRLFNEGNTSVEGIEGTLDIVGGAGLDDIYDIGNLTSDYPNIAGGASKDNIDAFEFSVKDLAEHGHWIDF